MNTPLRRLLARLHLSQHLHSGQAIVLIGAASIGLLAMMGLAIDGGRLLFLQRDVQNAADAAAIAAARALCTERDPEPYGLAAAAANGFNNNGTNNWVTVNTPPLSANFPIANGCEGCFVEVEVKKEIPPTFIGLVYGGELAATAHAVGICNPDMNGNDSMAPELRAVWAMSDSCPPDTLKISGSSITIQGGLHSNGEATIEGSANGNTICGASSVVATGSNGETIQGQSKIDWAASCYGDNPSETPPLATGLSCLSSCFVGGGEGDTIPTDGKPYVTNKETQYPVDYDINDYNDPAATGTAAAAAKASGEYFVVPSGSCKKFGEWLGDYHVHGGQLDNGIYYGDCDLTIDNKLPANITGNVTIVATGSIDVKNAESVNWAPYVDDLLLFSDSNAGCSNAIKFSGSNNVWNGNIFAPGGSIQMSASSNNTDIEGCLIGYSVQLSGSNNSITCNTNTSEDTPVPAIWMGE